MLSLSCSTVGEAMVGGQQQLQETEPPPPKYHGHSAHFCCPTPWPMETIISQGRAQDRFLFALPTAAKSRP